MIELFTADTPNGKKISIMLEEVGYKYKVTKIDLGNNDQDVIVSGVAPLDVLFGAIDQVNNVVVDDQDFIMPMTARRGSVLRFEIATIE